jgi:uncharacterized membrane protein
MRGVFILTKGVFMRIFYFIAMMMVILVLVYALGHKRCQVDMLHQHNAQKMQINQKIGG